MPSVSLNATVLRLQNQVQLVNIVLSIGTTPRSPRNQPNYDPSKRERKQSTRQSQNVVYVLTEFALELMRILEDFNHENFQSDGQLRIGKL